MANLQRWIAVLGGFLALAGGISIAANASESATFECTAGPSQVCFFSIVRQPAGMQTFVVQGHQRLAVAGLAPGRDWYLVAVNHPAPPNVIACRAAKFPCKIAIVHLGTNQ